MKNPHESLREAEGVITLPQRIQIGIVALTPDTAYTLDAVSLMAECVSGNESDPTAILTQRGTCINHPEVSYLEGDIESQSIVKTAKEIINWARRRHFSRVIIACEREYSSSLYCTIIKLQEKLSESVNVEESAFLQTFPLPHQRRSNPDFRPKAAMYTFLFDLYRSIVRT